MDCISREELYQIELEARLEAAEQEVIALRERIAQLTAHNMVDLENGREFAPNTLPLMSDGPTFKINASGYILFYDKRRDLYCLLHKQVGESKIGRSLRPDEQVHHKDRNRLHNTAHNLVVLTKEDHKKVHELLRAGRDTSAMLYIEQKEIKS